MHRSRTRLHRRWRSRVCMGRGDRPRPDRGTSGVCGRRRRGRRGWLHGLEHQSSTATVCTALWGQGLRRQRLWGKLRRMRGAKHLRRQRQVHRLLRAEVHRPRLRQRRLREHLRDVHRKRYLRLRWAVCRPAYACRQGVSARRYVATPALAGDRNAQHPSGCFVGWPGSNEAGVRVRASCQRVSERCPRGACNLRGTRRRDDRSLVWMVVRGRVRPSLRPGCGVVVRPICRARSLRDRVLQRRPDLADPA